MTLPGARGDSDPAAARNASQPALLILGPLQLHDVHRREVRVGGTRPRRLLAGLAVCSGEMVSIDELTETLWGGSPPRSARQNLHTYVWSLRRSLEKAAGSGLAIEAQPSGYVMRAAPGMLDWEEFRILSARAAGIASSDPAAAGRLLWQALRLWRGPLVAELTDSPPVLAARIAAMLEARMTALEQRIEADLRIGRHRELVAELARLVVSYPLREDFRAHQMVALYRCGRQAEALAVFHDLRRDLAVELGIDPSPQLGALYESVLRADPRLAWSGRPGNHGAGSLPNWMEPTRPQQRW